MSTRRVRWGGEWIELGGETDGNVIDSTVHQWRIDEGAGDIEDSVGSIGGTNNGATWVENSDYLGGHALEFPTDSDYVQFDSLPSAVGIDQAFSVGLTIQTDTASGGDDVTIWNHVDGEPSIIIGIRNGEIGASIYDGGWIDGASMTEPSAPYRFRLLMTYNGSDTVNLYADGEQQTGTETPGGALDTTAMVLGGPANIIGVEDPANNPFTGLADNLAIYDEVLTGTDVTRDWVMNPWP